jgi:hypothetical protein
LAQLLALQPLLQLVLRLQVLHLLQELLVHQQFLQLVLLLLKFLVQLLLLE